MELITEIGKRITRVKYVEKSNDNLTNGKNYDVVHIDFTDNWITVIDDRKKLITYYYKAFEITFF